MVESELGGLGWVGLGWVGKSREHSSVAAGRPLNRTLRFCCTIFVILSVRCSNFEKTDHRMMCYRRTFTKNKKMPTISIRAVILLLQLLLFHAFPVFGQHQSFGDTRFDLPADLPPEDSVPPIANSQDAAPSTAAPPTAPPATVTDAATVATAPPTPSPTPSAVPQPIEDVAVPPAAAPAQPALSAASSADTSSASPLPTIPSPAESVPPSISGTGTPNAKTPLPSLPNLIELPNFVENGNVQPITIPPSLIESPDNTFNNGTSTAPVVAVSTPLAPQPLPSSSPSSRHSPHQQVPSARVPPSLRSGHPKQQKQQLLPKDGQKIVVRSKEWFREEFDVRNCPKSSDALAKAIRAKFPKNLLRHGKDAVLAELLGTRLAECLRKQSENHWAKLDKLLKQHDKELDRNEKDECRAGLVEEQIACMNIHSFTCQFVHPSYLFRLLPTRIIVQEGRIAEEGAEKCQKFAQKLLLTPEQ